MRISIAILLLFSCCPILNAQLDLTGPDSVGTNQIAEINTNVDISQDPEGPSHLIEVVAPPHMVERARVYGSLVAIPTGCAAGRLVVKVRVISWKDRSISEGEVTIDVVSGDSPDPIPPREPDPVPMPDNDVTRSPLYKTAIHSYELIVDDNKAFWAKQLQKSFLFVVAEIDRGAYSDPDAMMDVVRKGNRGELGNTSWPKEGQKKWLPFFIGLTASLNTLEASGQLPDVESYKLHWRAVAQGLKVASGN